MNKPLRILHIVQGMNIGGIETMLMNLYRNINRDKIQFDFILSCPQESEYENEIISLGGKIFRVTPISMIFPHKYLLDVNKIFKDNPSYQIVHSHMNAVSALPLLVAKLNHIPVRICHAHTNGTAGFKGVFKRIIKYPLKYIANRYFACGKDAAAFLYGGWFFKSQFCYIINNAINIHKYAYDLTARNKIREQNIINNKFVIGHVGRFDPVKNHIFILEIFKIIHKSIPDAILLLVGNWKCNIKIKEKINLLGLDDAVLMTGVVSNVNEYLQAMDVYLFPSLYEGLGMSLIEAQCAGLPCIASDTVPKEAAITNLVDFLSLSQKAEIWANKIISVHKNKYQRLNTMKSIRNAGYDIAVTTRWLESFYIKEMVKINK